MVAAQYSVNLSVCGLLPLLLPGTAADAWRNLILVFTPTVLNALIWNRAARFSVQQRQHHGSQIHADDLDCQPALMPPLRSWLSRGDSMESACGGRPRQ